MLFYRVPSSGTTEVWAAAFSGDRKPRPYLASSFVQRHAQVSPDSQWVAYTSNETGRFEVYVQSFPNPTARTRISQAGGVQPRWRADGTELFFLTPDGTLMSVPVGASPTFEGGVPVPLFKTKSFGGTAVVPGYKQEYCVSRDGQRFLVNSQVEERTTSTITIVTNWAAQLNK
jgi:hypothetical protein